MEDYKELLISQYEYTENEAEVTSADLNEMDAESKEKLLELLDGKDITGYSYIDYSIGSLIENYKLNPIASLLTISELKKDYDLFSKMLKRGFK